SGNRALAVPFVDARVIQDRLDDVLGVMGWQDSYECLPDGSVVCRLKIRLGQEWIVKEDVGGESEQADDGDRGRAAFGDGRARAEKPASGQDVHRRLQEYDAKLTEQGLCKAGDLVKHVAQAGKKAGFAPDMTTWGEAEVKLAREETRAFEAKRREGTLKQVA